MIHQDVRAARIAANLTVSEVARRAGVPRKQVQALESGANVTLETVRKIVPVLPGLHRVTLGGLEIVTANADLEAAQQAARDLLEVAKRLMTALGAAAVAEVVPSPRAEDMAAKRERFATAIQEFKKQKRAAKRNAPVLHK